MNCLLYARVSTEKQADKDLSIPAQLQAMHDHARQHAWTVAEEFVEPGASAKTADRPALRRLLTRVQEPEGGVQIVLVHKVDRLARNVHDHAVIKALLKKHGVRLASVVENVDDSIPGQLVENIMASIAEFYSANLGEEVRKGMRQKVLKGGWPHLPPLGYAVAREGDSKGFRIVIDPVAGPLVRLAFELYVTGRWGVRALAQHLREQGLRSRTGKPLAQSNIRKMLANPFFTGNLRWKGREFPGRHPALVPQELFAQVQQVIRQRWLTPAARLTASAFPLKAVAVCASCRGSMTAELHESWGYYRCCRRMADKTLCSARLCNAKAAHLGLQAICTRLRLSPEVSAAIDDAVRTLIDHSTNAQKSSQEVRRRQKAMLINREMRLTKTFADGEITPQTFQTLVGGLRTESQLVEAELKAIEASPERIVARVKEILAAARDIWDLFGAMTPTRQVELLRVVFEVVVLSKDGIAGYVLREPFRTIFAATDETGDIRDREADRSRESERLARQIVSAVGSEGTT